MRLRDRRSARCRFYALTPHRRKRVNESRDLTGGFRGRDARSSCVSGTHIRLSRRPHAPRPPLRRHDTNCHEYLFRPRIFISKERSSCSTSCDATSSNHALPANPRPVKHVKPHFEPKTLSTAMLENYMCRTCTNGSYQRFPQFCERGRTEFSTGILIGRHLRVLPAHDCIRPE